MKLLYFTSAWMSRKQKNEKHLASVSLKDLVNFTTNKFARKEAKDDEQLKGPTSLNTLKKHQRR